MDCWYFRFPSNLIFFSYSLLVQKYPKIHDKYQIFCIFFVRITYVRMSLNVSSGKSLFESEIKINFKTVLSVSLSIWKISNFSIEYFLHKSAIYFCGKQKVSVFANVSNFPDINQVVTFISFLFLQQKISCWQIPYC